MSSVEPDPLPSHELATFVAATDAASVHGAADALDLTASAVTKRLQALERRLGVSLFERGRFGLRATEAGRLLYPEARVALAALQRARETLGEHRDVGAVRLSLAASHTVGEFLLPGWLAVFTRTEPGVRAQVAIVNSPGVLAAVGGGEAEVGFVEGHDDLSGLDTLVVRPDVLVAVVGSGHRWARRRTVRVGELATEPYISREAGSGTRAVADDALHAGGLQLEPTLEVASIQSVKRTVGVRGFALMSPLAVEAEVRAGTLHTLEVSGAKLERSLTAVRDPGRTPGRAAASFWRWLAADAAA